MLACPACGGSNGAEARFCSSCGVSLGVDGGAPTRKTVTFLYSDLSGFTALGEQLDPESQHQVMSRYFSAMHAVIERHGGRVEKYIGDAIMAVFGVPEVHEDDAVRAARCALEMREALAALNVGLQAGWGVTLHARCGLSTGEVAFARVGDNPFFALGDAVNLAQRLETAAPTDEVLVSPQTAGLLRAAADLEPLEPFRVKGKAAPVAAWRLLRLRGERDTRDAGSASRMVAREDELRALHEAFGDVVRNRRCRLVSVLGAAGVGKSCLVRRFASDVRESATVVLGRCLSYGEGITFSPLAEVVEQLAGGIDVGSIARLVGDDDDAALTAERIARAVGSAQGAAPLEEIQLAVRRLLEAAARGRPLVVVIEDVHWAEPTLVDVLEHVAWHAHDVPLLLVCPARPEALGRMPTAALHDTVRLDALSDDDARRLLERLDARAAADPSLRDRLLGAAEGNPFFLEQLVAAHQEGGSPGRAMPGTIQAVLAARIDRLSRAERAVADCGAVEGRVFHRDVVRELLGVVERDGLDDALGALVGRELVRPEGPGDGGDGAYRFAHVLIRDEVYALLPKARRADLHERFARMLAARPAAVRDAPEIIGFHLEQAHRCSADVQPVPGPEQRRLAGEAARHLGGGGRAAVGRGDLPAAVNLLQRATALLGDDDPERARLAPELGSALTQAGRLEDAERLLGDAVTRADALGRPLPAAHARVCLLLARMQVETGSAVEEVRRDFDDLLTTFTAEGDDLGLDRLWNLRALVHWVEARSADAEAAWAAAVRHATSARDAYGRADALCWLASSAFTGPAPVEEGIVRCERIRADLRGTRRAEAFVLQPLAGLRAMRGDFATARELLAESNALLEELGTTMHTAVPWYEAHVALLAGDAPGAERALRAGYDRLRRMGERALFADTAAMLARAVLAQERFDEASALTREAESAGDPDDLSAQVGWRLVRARVLVHEGALAEADRLSAEAVELVAGTDWLGDRADVLTTRAEVLHALGETSAARDAAAAALALHDQKGNVVGGARMREALRHVTST